MEEFLPLEGKRIVYAYPFAPANTGGWIRCSQTLAILRDAGAQVTAIIHEGNHRETAVSGIDFVIWKDQFIFHHAGAILESLPSTAELRQADPHQALFSLAHRLEVFNLIEGYREWVTELCRGADIVCIEYSFLAELYSLICKELEIPLVISQLDILHKLYSSSEGLRAEFRDIELSALQKADALFCLSEDDQAILSSHGLESVLTPFTGKAEPLRPPINDHGKVLLAQFGLGERNLALFVGSNHPPNREAALFLKELAPKIPEVDFVVAGSCFEPARSENFISLGVISIDLLSHLYTHARCVLVPLQSGGGMSLKTYEAAERRKAIVSTRVGARGHSFEDGHDILLAESQEEFVTQIKSLLNDPNHADTIAGNARSYAEKYDCRVILQKYIEVIGGLLGEAQSEQTTRLPERSNGLNVIYLDQNLKSFVGHHGNYFQSVQAEIDRQGGSVILLASKEVEAEMSEVVIPTFSSSYHHEPEGSDFLTGNAVKPMYSMLQSNERIFHEMKKSFSLLPDSEHTIFLPNAHYNNLLSVVGLIGQLPQLWRPKVVAIFRYNITALKGFADGQPMLNRVDHIDELYRICFRGLEQIADGGVVRLFTDGEGLRDEYQELTNIPIGVVPIPHGRLPDPICPPELKEKTEGIRRITFLGDARKEKGFNVLPGLLSFLQRAPEFNEQVEFVFQAYISDPCHDEMKAFIQELKDLNCKNLTLIERSISPNEYTFVVESSDIILLPYDVGTYYHRTSGPFVEAISNAIPVIVPDGTWMASTLREFGEEGGKIFVPTSGDSLLKQIVDSVREFTALKEAATLTSQRFLAAHNPGTFIDSCFY